MGEAIGIRDLRQNASEIVRNLERGETYTLKVNGREVGELRLDRRSQWVSWEVLKKVLSGPTDPTWEDDLRLLDSDIEDPWERARVPSLIRVCSFTGLILRYSVTSP